MTRKIILNLFLYSLLFVQFSNAQNEHTFNYARQNTINLSNQGVAWQANVFSTEAAYPGSDSYRAYLQQLKMLRYDGVERGGSKKYTVKKTTSETPIKSTGFKANNFGGIPNDNDLAISNDGKIVSVTNSTMNVYDESGTELLVVDLQDFADSLALNGSSYDPKVIYDPDEDRFIMVFLNGNDATQTSIVLAFSQTNDPTQNWNLYYLAGNPFNNNAWSDFPMIAITKQDFYVTVNHINSDSASWQTGFMQSVIWQVQKAEGYNGNTITSKVHNNIKYNNRFIRNLMPVKGGFDIKNEEMYFVSNRNFDLENDTFFLVHIPQSLSSNANVGYTTQAVLANNVYGLPPNARQTNNTFLQTNDARPLSGFIENGIINFVGNTVDTASNLASIYHAKLSVMNTNLFVDLHIISDTIIEYGYPNISFTGFSNFDEQAIISFNHTSIDSFPGMSAIFYDVNDGYSERLHLKSGNTFVNLISGNNERWGDYSGSQKRYNKPGEVWISGFVGKYLTSGISRNRHETYVYKLATPDSTYLTDSTLNTISNNIAQSSAKIYPNPVNDNHIFIDFESEIAQNVSFYVYTVDGKIIDKIITDKVKKGKNTLTLSTQKLTTGVYLIKATDQNNNLIFTSKIIKN
ncbi:MAG: T9SS type A sorting domain-containing protein [Chitinophagales bacterium]|nr:T9SS type A sorting domain-containing protein [Chitinophagales bacterium]